MFGSRYMPCEHCGESLDRLAPPSHTCSPERRADFEMFALRADVAAFEERFRTYTETTAGRFDVWLAAQEVRRAA